MYDIILYIYHLLHVCFLCMMGLEGRQYVPAHTDAMRAGRGMRAGRAVARAVADATTTTTTTACAATPAMAASPATRAETLIRARAYAKPTAKGFTAPAASAAARGGGVRVAQSSSNLIAEPYAGPLRRPTLMEALTSAKGLRFAYESAVSRGRQFISRFRAAKMLSDGAAVGGERDPTKHLEAAERFHAAQVERQKSGLESNVGKQRAAGFAAALVSAHDRALRLMLDYTGDLSVEKLCEIHGHSGRGLGNRQPILNQDANHQDRKTHFRQNPQFEWSGGMQ